MTHPVEVFQSRNGRNNKFFVIRESEFAEVSALQRVVTINWLLSLGVTEFIPVEGPEENLKLILAEYNSVKENFIAAVILVDL